MLLLMFTERTLCGNMSQEKQIEVAVVSRLALAPMSFSQLTETLPEHLPQHKTAFNNVLNRVADFVDPKVRKGVARERGIMR
jgi:hypothetical protein